MKLLFKVLTLVLVSWGFMAANVSALITIDTLPVGDAGNANDTTTGFGAVGYNYGIGKYEVTLNQYCSFLNAVAKTDRYGLYSAPMGNNPNIMGIARSGMSGSYTYSVIGSCNRPVTYVSWFDAARFVNWLHNGQPTGVQAAGTTETGAYTLNGALTGIITRNAGWTYGLPSENEWYKAAYYQPAAQGGDSDDYWLYPTASNAMPTSRDGSASDANSVNFYLDDSIANGFNGGYAASQSPSYSASQPYLSEAGAFGSADSFYGTFDQGGNVWEWNDAVIGSARGWRGGSWGNLEGFLRASNRNGDDPAYGLNVVGFRIVVVPEPSVVVMAGLGMTMVVWQRKRPL